MNKIFCIMISILLSTGVANAQLSFTGGSSGVITASDCSSYTTIGQLCQDTDDDKLYKGTGEAVEEVAGGVSTYAEIEALADYPAVVTSSGTITADHATCWSADGTTIIACGAKVALDDDIVTGLLYYNSVSGEVENPPATLSIATNILTTGYLGGRALGIIVPKPSGTSTDVPSETVLTHADDGSATDAYVGMTLYNVTDSVSGTVTASTSTTITVAAGGMSWANTNVYQLGPGPAQSGSIFYVGAAGTLRHPATVGYVAGYYQTTTGVLIVNPAADTMVITHATAGAIDAGDAIDGPATAGAFIWLHNASATLAYTHGKNGTWTDGGAD